MITTKEAVLLFAQWSYAWAAKDEPGLDAVKFQKDYLQYHRVVVANDEILAIDMQLGAFDHGAGNGMLICAWGYLIWLYEDKVDIIASLHSTVGGDKYELSFPSEED